MTLTALGRRMWGLSPAFKFLLAVGAAMFIALVRYMYVEHARRELVAFAAQVQVGDDIQQVVAQCHRELSFPLGCEESEGQLVVTTPAEYGSSNWLLFVGHAGGRVASVRIRSVSQLCRAPSIAPADRGADVASSCVALPGGGAS